VALRPRLSPGVLFVAVVGCGTVTLRSSTATVNTSRRAAKGTRECGWLQCTTKFSPVPSFGRLAGLPFRRRFFPHHADFLGNTRVVHVRGDSTLAYEWEVSRTRDLITPLNAATVELRERLAKR
jgi:hypothetical protein